MDVRFPKLSVTSTLPDNYIDTEKQLKETKWKREKMLEDIKREQALLDAAKQSFERKKEEFVKFLAQSSAYATRVRLEHILLFVIDGLLFNHLYAVALILCVHVYVQKPRGLLRYKV